MTCVLGLDNELVEENEMSIEGGTSKIWNIEALGTENEDAVHRQLLNKVDINNAQHELSHPYRPYHTITDNVLL